MSFRQFVKHVQDGDDSLYLSTQPMAVGVNGHPEVVAPPVANLLQDLEQQPAIMGHLVPQQINLWFGVSPTGNCPETAPLLNMNPLITRRCLAELSK
jgi:hypothetical protein